MKTTLTLRQADDLAHRLIGELSDCCVKIEPAGSVRRRSPAVGDIELVAIPKRAALFGGDDGDGLGESLLDVRLANLAHDGRIKRIKGGERYVQYAVGAWAVQLDLWLTDPERWGVIYAIRTGSADFARSLVNQRCHGGRLPDGLCVHDGRVWKRDDLVVMHHDYRGDGGRRKGRTTVSLRDGALPAVDTSSERDFLGLCGGWVDPCNRVR